MKILSGPELEPISGGKAKQLVLLLHGLGADGNDLIGLAPEFSDVLPDAHFIAPNAPFQCDMSPYGYQWFSLLDRNPKIVLEGVKEAAPILNKFIDESLKRFGLDDNKLALIGFSQGTMMSLYVAPRRSKACAGVVGYSGALVGADILKNEIKSRPPICLAHGDADMVVPFDAMGIAEETLKKNGVSVETLECPGVAHGISLEGVEIGKRFLQEKFGIK